MEGSTRKSGVGSEPSQERPPNPRPVSRTQSNTKMLIQRIEYLIDEATAATEFLDEKTGYGHYCVQDALTYLSDARYEMRELRKILEGRVGNDN